MTSPTPRKRPVGRPAFKPTAAQRVQVSIGAAGGMSHEAIAMALGIARQTLENNFAEELSTGAHQRRLSWLAAMDKAARSGNVAAQKALLATTATLSVPPLPKEPNANPKLGKKEQADADATTAHVGTEWGELLNGPGTMQ